MAAFDPSLFSDQLELKRTVLETFTTMMDTSGMGPEEAAAATLDILENIMRAQGVAFMPRLCALWLANHIKETMG